MCSATVGLSDQGASGDQAIDTLHRFRDEVMAEEPAGRHYMDLYEENTERLSVLMLQEPDLRSEAARRRLRRGPHGLATLRTLVRAAPRRWTRGALAMALALSGCGGRSGNGGPLPPDVLVRYQCFGGVAGFEDTIVVARTGRTTITDARLNREKTVQLSARTMQRLERALEHADFDSLKSSYGSDNFPDAMELVITYRDKTVRGGLDLPSELSPAMTILADTINRKVYNYPSSRESGQP